MKIANANNDYWMIRVERRSEVTLDGEGRPAAADVHYALARSRTPVRNKHVYFEFRIPVDRAQEEMASILRVGRGAIHADEDFDLSGAWLGGE